MAEHRVRRLTIHAPDRTSAARGQQLLQQAFNAASMPVGPAGAVLLIRHLDLGAFSTDVSLPTLAEQIGARIRAVAGRAIWARTAAAATAPAVWFAGSGEARAALIEHLIRGSRPSEWFWPAAVPGFTVRQPLGLALRHAWTPAPRTRTDDLPAVRVRAAVVEELLRRRLLVAALGSPATPSTLWAALPTPTTPPLLDTTTVDAVPRLEPSLRRELQAVVRRFGPLDPRTRFAVTYAVLATRPWLSTPALAAPSVEAVMQQLAQPQPPPPPAQRDARPGPVGTPPPARPSRHPDRMPPSKAEPPREPAPVPRPVRGRAALLDTPGEDEQKPPHDSVAPELVARLDPRFTPVRTVAAGLFFLIHLLERTKLPEHCSDAPLAGWRALVAVLIEIGVPRDDPMWEVVLEPFEEHPVAVTAVDLERLRGLRDQLLDDELDLTEVVIRPGYLHSSPTHVDLLFHFEQSDVRLRRLGLDLNPGWVRWLGRIVTFHYRDHPEQGGPY